MRPLPTGTAAFVAVVLTGGLWIALAQRISPGQPGTAIALVGGVFGADDGKEAT